MFQSNFTRDNKFNKGLMKIYLMVQVLPSYDSYRYLVNSKVRKLLPTQIRKELISSIVKRLSKYHNGVKIFLNEYSQLHTTQLSRDLHQEIMSFMKLKKKIGDISGASKSKCSCKKYFYPL